MKAMRKMSLLGLGLVALIVGAVMAEPPGRGERAGRPGRPDRQPGGSPLLRLFDADTNGELSADEIAHASAVLLTFDADSNGMLTQDELRMGRPEGAGAGHGGRGGPPEGGAAMGGARILRHDTDGDGVVTFEEFSTSVNEAFTALDKNGDKVIDADEAAAAPTAQQGKRAAKAPPAKKGSGN
jgi:hypothetical protein